MRLPVFEMFYSVQGEGENVGMSAYFIRLAGCNVGCPFCDEKKAWNVNDSSLMEVEQIVEKVLESQARNVVITGGEPTIYDLSELTSELQKHDIDTFLETSGVNEIKGSFSHITLSPKQNMLPLCDKDSLSNKEVFSFHIDSLKVVISSDLDFVFAEHMRKRVDQEEKVSFFLQPDWNKKDEMTVKIIDYIKQNPQWRLSLQTHKYIDVK